MKQDKDLYESWKYDYTEITDFSECSLKCLTRTYVICPKHGKHQHTISSNIPGYEGVWCQLCWLETLGPSFESVQEPFEYQKDGE